MQSFLISIYYCVHESVCVLEYFFMCLRDLKKKLYFSMCACLLAWLCTTFSRSSCVVKDTSEPSLFSTTKTKTKNNKKRELNWSITIFAAATTFTYQGLFKIKLFLTKIF